MIGPFIACATLIVAIRLPALGDVLGGLFDNAVLPWILGAMMLALGLVVIAFHQYWHGFTAIAISLFGWFVALRGLTLMAFPTAIESGAGSSIDSPALLLGARVFFLLMTTLGLWLTYVGWVSRRPVDNSGANSP